MEHFPTIDAEVVFLPYEEGGRVQLPTFDGSPFYMPHIVMQDRGVRAAAADKNGVSCEQYQGVRFVSGPTNYRPGERGLFRVELMYFPGLDYATVQPGATFTVREGGKIVAHGVVLNRQD